MVKGYTAYRCLKSQRVAPSISVLHIQPMCASQAIDYQSGQYVKIKCLDEGDQAPLLMSIANAPNERQTLELHLRHSETEHPQACAFLSMLESKGELWVSEPLGHMRLPETPRPLCLIAGGTGISPMKALIESAISRQWPFEITLYWGLRNAQAHYLKASLNQWSHALRNFQAILTYSDVNTPLSDNALQGRVEHHLKKPKCPNSVWTYLSGPFGMIQVVKRRLNDFELPGHHIFSDFN